MFRSQFFHISAGCDDVKEMCASLKEGEVEGKGSRGGPRGSPAHDTSFINRGPQTDGAIPDPHKYVDMIHHQRERAN